MEHLSSWCVGLPIKYDKAPLIKEFPRLRKKAKITIDYLTAIGDKTAFYLDFFWIWIEDAILDNVRSSPKRVVRRDRKIQDKCLEASKSL